MFRNPYVSGVVMFGIVIVSYVSLVLVGKDTTSFLPFVLAASSALVPGIATLTKQQKTDAKVDIIQDQTNGRITGLIERVESIDARLKDKGI